MKKSISAENMNIVVDNAVIPTKTLVAQAVESIVLEDSPHSRDGTTIDQLGLSCRCVLNESENWFSDCSINSEEDATDDDEDFMMSEPPSGSAPAEPVGKDSRWTSTSLPAKQSEGLVCPVRPSSLSSSSDYNIKLNLTHPTRGMKRRSSSTRMHRDVKKDWAALLDRAIHTSSTTTEQLQQRRQENRLKFLDQAIAFVSDDVRKIAS